jgi:hypothetical protein
MWGGCGSGIAQQVERDRHFGNYILGVPNRKEVTRQVTGRRDNELAAGDLNPELTALDALRETMLNLVALSEEASLLARRVQTHVRRLQGQLGESSREDPDLHC